jgi:hypothetical protein
MRTFCRLIPCDGFLLWQEGLAGFDQLNVCRKQLDRETNRNLYLSFNEIGTRTVEL